jgi:multiple sugar transport system permease protein
LRRSAGSEDIATPATPGSIGPGGVATIAPTNWWRTRDGKQAIAFYLFLSPWIIGFIVFQVAPMVASAGLLFASYDILSPPKWTGFDNLRTMFFEDKLFWKSLKVTAEYTFIVVPATTVVGYSLALLLNRDVAGRSLWRTAYYMPAIVPVVATAYLWGWLLNRDFGAINGALWDVFRIKGPNWFGSEDWVMPAFILMTLWASGGGILLYLAAMQQVPTTFYEAAKVDGANMWQRLVNVTIPMTSFVIFFNIVTGLITTFQIFAAGFILTDGGPNNASLFYVLYLYRNGWIFLKMGYAAALAWFLFFVILILTIIIMRMARPWVYYEGQDR